MASYTPSETASEPQDYYLSPLPTRHPSRIRGLRAARAVCIALNLPEEEHSLLHYHKKPKPETVGEENLSLRDPE